MAKVKVIKKAIKKAIKKMMIDPPSTNVAEVNKPKTNKVDQSQWETIKSRPFPRYIFKVNHGLHYEVVEQRDGMFAATYHPNVHPNNIGPMYVSKEIAQQECFYHARDLAQDINIKLKS